MEFAGLGGPVCALERLADLVKPDTRVVAANGRVMTGREIVRHGDMYQKLFTTTPNQYHGRPNNQRRDRRDRREDLFLCVRGDLPVDRREIRSRRTNSPELA
jgi:hypothetical protein